MAFIRCCRSDGGCVVGRRVGFAEEGVMSISHGVLIGMHEQRRDEIWPYNGDWLVVWRSASTSIHIGRCVEMAAKPL